MQFCFTLSDACLSLISLKASEFLGNYRSGKLHRKLFLKDFNIHLPTRRVLGVNA